LLRTINNKVIIQLKGGLGNQLFQYTFGKYLSLILEKELVIDHSYYELYPNVQGVTHRNLEINYFKNIGDKKVNVSFLKKLPSSRIFYYLFQFILKLKYSPVLVNDETKIDELETSRNLLCDGYFQKVNYANQICKQIQNLLTMDDNVNINNILSEIKNSNSVSLHVRRTDYLETVNKNLGLAFNFDYYIQAVGHIKKNVQDPCFFIFSDDLDWCKKNLSILEPYKVVYVDCNLGSSSFKDIIFMSKCKHNIIANSSFSWWGAWLNLNLDKIVIMPKIWKINDDEFVNDLVDNSWIVI
jgi:hypothetical protein